MSLKRLKFIPAHPPPPLLVVLPIEIGGRAVIMKVPLSQSFSFSLSQSLSLALSQSLSQRQ